jgi:hypothetical protein
MADKSIFVRIVRLMNFGCAAIMCYDGVMRLFDLKDNTDPFFFLLSIYLFGFAALLVLAEIRYKRMLVYIEFLKHRIGKGIYVMLIGLLLFDETRKTDMFSAIIIVLVGFFNLIVGCMRESMFHDEDKPLFANQFDSEAVKGYDESKPIEIIVDQSDKRSKAPS